ncbi:MAG: hypothetical protein WA419_07640 [Silvibacterium sp.]
MDDTKLDELRSILRDLSWLIGQQQEIILAQTSVIGAIRITLQNDPDLSKKYAANLQSLKDGAHGKPDLAAMSLASGLLDRMTQW